MSYRLLQCSVNVTSKYMQLWILNHTKAVCAMQCNAEQCIYHSFNMCKCHLVTNIVVGWHYSIKIFRWNSVSVSEYTMVLHNGFVAKLVES